MVGVGHFDQACSRCPGSVALIYVKAAHPAARETALMADVIEINRAPVLTLWAAVVAERLGFDWDEALTLGQRRGWPQRLQQGRLARPVPPHAGSGA